MVSHAELELCQLDLSPGGSPKQNKTKNKTATTKEKTVPTSQEDKSPS